MHRTKEDHNDFSFSVRFNSPLQGRFEEANRAVKKGSIRLRGDWTVGTDDVVAMPKPSSRHAVVKPLEEGPCHPCRP